MNRDFTIRSLLKADISQVHAIEKEVYEDPWNIQLFHESLSAPMTHLKGLFDGETLLSYAVYQVVFTEAHLLNIAVKKDVQAKGLGSRMLDHVMIHSLDLGGLTFFLEVRPSNKRARQIYERKGFKFLMVRENYYSDNESAVIMVKDLIPKRTI